MGERHVAPRRLQDPHRFLEGTIVLGHSLAGSSAGRLCPVNSPETSSPKRSPGRLSAHRDKDADSWRLGWDGDIFCSEVPCGRQCVKEVFQAGPQRLTHTHSSASLAGNLLKVFRYSLKVSEIENNNTMLFTWLSRLAQEKRSCYCARNKSETTMRLDENLMKTLHSSTSHAV